MLSQVQLQLLTATVKLFLKRPKNTKDMVCLALAVHFWRFNSCSSCTCNLAGLQSMQVLRVLDLATTECENPDLRDRGFVYWRLLTNPQAAKSVVLTERPLIQVYLPIIASVFVLLPFSFVNI